jgi:hypothetical protein
MTLAQGHGCERGAIEGVAGHFPLEWVEPYEKGAKGKSFPWLNMRFIAARVLDAWLVSRVAEQVLSWPT